MGSSTSQIAVQALTPRHAQFGWSSLRSGKDSAFLRRLFEVGRGAVAGERVLVMEPAHAGQRPLGVAADGDQLGGNGYGNFFRSECAEIQTDGSVDFLEKRCGKALLGEFAEDGNGLSLGADHADIAG